MAEASRKDRAAESAASPEDCPPPSFAAYVAGMAPNPCRVPPRKGSYTPLDRLPCAASAEAI